MSAKGKKTARRKARSASRQQRIIEASHGAPDGFPVREPLSLEDFMVKTSTEGLGYALAYYWPDSAFDEIAQHDAKLAEDCRQAKALLVRIDERLDEIAADSGIARP